MAAKESKPNELTGRVLRGRFDIYEARQKQLQNLVFL